MICYRCGRAVDDELFSCGACGQRHTIPPRGAGAVSDQGTEAAEKRRTHGDGDCIAGRYEVDGLIGSGPVGLVYRAFDVESGGRVAVKVYDEGLHVTAADRDVFMKEAALLEGLSHPGCVKVYGAGFEGDRAHLVMQLVEGESLREIIDRKHGKGQSFDLDEIETFFLQICSALDHAHGLGAEDGQGVAHGHVRPEDVIVPPGLLKVVGFGEASFTPRHAFVSAHSALGGTPPHLAPEVMFGEAVTPASDMYGLGTILCELLAREPARAGRASARRRDAQVPEGMSEVIQALLAFRPEHRYQRAAQVAEDLTSVLAGEVPSQARSLAAAAVTVSPAAVSEALVDDPSAATPATEPGASPAPTPEAPALEPREEEAPALEVSEEKPPAEEPQEEAPALEVSEEKPPAEEPQEEAPALEVSEEKPPAEAPPVTPIEQAVDVDTSPEDALGAASAVEASDIVEVDGEELEELELADEDIVEELAQNAEDEAAGHEEAPRVSGASAQPATPPAAGDPREGSGAGRTPPAPPSPPPAPKTSGGWSKRQIGILAAVGVVLLIAALVSNARRAEQFERQLTEGEPLIEETALAEASPPPEPETAEQPDELSDEQGDPEEVAAAEEATAPEQAAPVAAAAPARPAAPDDAPSEAAEPVRPAARDEIPAARERVVERPAPAREEAAVTPAVTRRVEEAPSAPAPEPPPPAAAPPPEPPCPGDMVLIPAGSFQFGSAPNDPLRNFGEHNLRQVSQEAFCIDRHEYGGRGRPPVVGVTWHRAKELCESRERRLCSEEEWERACKGPRNLRFPYGNSFDATACNTEDSSGRARRVASGGSFQDCGSAFGVLDMSGNVAEWTDSIFQQGVSDRTIKGGAANSPDYEARCAARGNRPPGSRDAMLGFRCCRDPS